MTINLVTRNMAGLVALTALLGFSTSALADHHDRGRQGATYDYAKVLSSEPVIRYVTVKTPVRECWEETEYYAVNRRPAGGGGALFGAIIGSVIGHQFGSGSGNDAATIAGGLLGAAIGSDASRSPYTTTSGRREEARTVERCETKIRQHQEERIDGYRVVYLYNGQKYATTMPNDPGPRLRVRVDIRPVR